VRDLTIEELELLESALSTYRETVSELERTHLHSIQEIQDTLRQEWRYIKGWDN